MDNSEINRMRRQYRGKKGGREGGSADTLVISSDSRGAVHSSVVHKTPISTPKMESKKQIGTW